MKIVFFLVLLVLFVTLKLMTDKNKKTSESNKARMTLKALAVRYKREIGEIRTKEKIAEFFNQFGLSHHWKSFQPEIRKEVHIELSPNTALELGKSKFGGLPDLPTHIAWFREDNGKPLSFVGQLNLSELSGALGSGSLPEKGMLYFFYSAEQEAWGFDPKDSDKFKVFYAPDGTELVKKSGPDDLENYHNYLPCGLTFSEAYSLPNWERAFATHRFTDFEKEVYMLVEYPEINHKLFGYSNAVQGEMELECQLVTNGINCGDPSGYSDPRAHALEKGKEDWILLLQVDSDEKTGMMWGDSGRLYFWIRQQDLEQLHFDKAWCILQCY